jgi:hypothetical protein
MAAAAALTVAPIVGWPETLEVHPRAASARCESGTPRRLASALRAA